MLQDILRIYLPFHLPIVGNQIVIHGFGLMLVIGFLCAMALAKFLARRSGQDSEAFANAALLALFANASESCPLRRARNLASAIAQRNPITSIRPKPWMTI